MKIDGPLDVMLCRLWHWLRSRFTRNSDAIPYRAGERLVFRYWNGSRWVSADPLVLYRRITEHGDELKADMAVASMTIPNQWTGPAQAKVAERFREIFNLAPLHNGVETTLPDGTQTLTDTEAGDLFGAFMDWCEELKKKHPISSTPSMATLDSIVLPGGAPATPPSPASSSSDAAPSIDRSPPLPTEPASPSVVCSPESSSIGPSLMESERPPS